MAGLAAAVSGRLHASIGEGGASVCAEAPLELRGPFTDGSYFLRNTTAGIFGGDAYAVDVTATGGSSVRVASSSASKVYAGDGAVSTLGVRLAAEPGATLVWGSHATIVQAGASYQQETLVEVSQGGRVLLGEILVLGRPAHGDCFGFRRLESGLEVRLEGVSAYQESFVLQPGPDLVASMAGRPVLASVYALGFQSSVSWGCALWDEALAGWSELPNEAGIVVRALRGSLSQGQELVERLIARLLAASDR